MPPFDGVFAFHPAQIHDLAIAHVREIAEAFVEVFDFDALFQNFLNSGDEPGQCANVFTRVHDSAAAGLAAGQPGFGRKPSHGAARTVNFLPEPFDFRQQGIGFIKREQSHCVC